MVINPLVYRWPELRRRPRSPSHPAVTKGCPSPRRVGVPGVGFVSRTCQINQTSTLKNQKEKTQSGGFKEKKRKRKGAAARRDPGRNPLAGSVTSGVFCPCGVWHPSPALARRLPPLPARGAAGRGSGGFFFQGGSGELGRLIVLFVSQSHAVMSAVTSCSALPIGLRCLPAGPASRPPNFPCTPLRSHRPGRGSPRAAGPRRAGGEQRGTAPERSPPPPPGPDGHTASVASPPGSAEPRGPAGLEPNLYRGLGSAGNPLVLPGQQARGNGCLWAGSCRSVPSFPLVFRCDETPVLPLRPPEEFGARPGTSPSTLAEFGSSLSFAGS